MDEVEQTRQLLSLFLSLNKKAEDLERVRKENEELNKRIAELGKRRYVSADPQTEQKRIKITDRLCQLGLVDPDKMAEVSSKKTVSIGGVSYFNAQTHEGKRLTVHITEISKKMSKARKQLFGSHPVVTPKTRVNFYSDEDYCAFGDEIIAEYVKTHPIKDWGCGF